MKYILKDLKNNPIFSLFFIINIAVGLWGISVIEIFQYNLQAELQKTAKASSGADITISSRKYLSENQIDGIKNILPKGSDFDETRSMYSMLGGDEESILVNVKAVGEKFPFYGEIELESGGFINAELKNNLYKSADIIVSEDVLVKLDKTLGDEIRLGQKTFVISDIIKKDLGMSWSGASLAPSVYIGFPYLKETGLLDTGSTYFKNYLIKLPENSDENSYLSSIKDLIEDPGINIKSYRNSGQISSRIFSYVTDYLGIVSLCALFLSCAGIYYLIKAFFEKKYKDIAIYLSVGMNRSRIISLYMFQILILATLGSVLNMGLGLISIPVLSNILSRFTDLDIAISIDYVVFLKVLLISLSVCLLLSLPEILYIRKVKASSLFSEDQLDISKTINFRLLPAVCLLFGLSIWISNSFKIGSVFFLSLIIGSLIIVSFNFSFIKLLEPSSKLNYRLKQAFRYILHHKAESALYILCIGVSACLLNLIPQIQNSLNKELDLNSHKDRPSLFIFDIQEYQLEDLKQVLEKIQPK